MNFSSILSRCAALALAIGVSTAVHAQVSLTTTGTNVYTQDFDTLAQTGNGNTLTLPGWYAVNNTDTTYTASAVWSGGNTRDLYSFGATGSSDRALGSATTTTGTAISYGVAFTNNTAYAISSVTLSFALESYKLPSSPPVAIFNDVVVGSYGFNNGSLTGGLWTDSSLISLSYQDPADPASPHSLTFASAWAPGDTLWFRWSDPSTTGQNAALAIDNLALSITPVPEPSTYAIILGACTLAVVGFRRFRTR